MEQARLEEQQRAFERRRDAALEAQEARDVARRNQQEAQSASNTSFLLMVFGTARSGENSRYRGTSWHFRLSAGLGFMWVPVAEESTTSTDSAGSSTSSTSSNVGAGGGIGMNLGLEIWPVYNHYLSVGGFAEGAIAYLSGTGSSQFGYSGIVGARALLGVDWVSLIVEIGTGVRGASTTSDSTFGYSDVYISTASSGSEDYSLSRLGAGVRFCFSRSEAAWRQRTVARACQSGLDLMGFLEQPSIVDVTDPVNLWRVSFWSSNFGAITGEFGNYPVSPGSDDYSGRDGFYLTISLVKPFDWFGEPYVEPTVDTRADDATGPPTLDSAGSGTVGGGSPTIALGPSDVQVPGRCVRGEVSGRWVNGASFEMELRQQGAIVTGHYRVGSTGTEGDLQGTLTPDGAVLTGNWAETNGRFGRFEWTFDEQAATFAGHFGNNTDPLTLQWVASRDCSGR